MRSVSYTLPSTANSSAAVLADVDSISRGTQWSVSEPIQPDGGRERRAQNREENIPPLRQPSEPAEQLEQFVAQ
jgi:hypothetical protein